MSENRTKILEMLAQNKISVDEAGRLLNALGAEDSGAARPPADAAARAKPKYLRVTVLPDPDSADSQHFDRVNIRVPVSLIRAGVKLTSLIPPEARDKVNGALREKGIDFDVRNIKPEDLDELVDALSELEVDVVGGKGDKIRVFTE
jgi:hypothetical protein